MLGEVIRPTHLQAGKAPEWVKGEQVAQGQRAQVAQCAERSRQCIQVVGMCGIEAELRERCARSSQQ